MKVTNGNLGPIRPEKPRDPTSQPPIGKGPQPTPAAAPSAPVDRVEISDAGRARAGKLDPVSPNATDRLEQIRQRVLQGAYDTDGVVEDVARRIAESGDI